jgi:hypothetical protein
MMMKIAYLYSANDTYLKQSFKIYREKFESYIWNVNESQINKVVLPDKGQNLGNLRRITTEERPHHTLHKGWDSTVSIIQVWQLLFSPCAAKLMHAIKMGKGR